MQLILHEVKLPPSGWINMFWKRVRDHILRAAPRSTNQKKSPPAIGSVSAQLGLLALPCLWCSQPTDRVVFTTHKIVRPGLIIVQNCQKWNKKLVEMCLNCPVNPWTFAKSYLWNNSIDSVNSQHGWKWKHQKRKLHYSEQFRSYPNNIM